MKKIVGIIAVLAGLASCVYPYNPEFEETSEDIIVFEGSIVAGGTSTFQFSKVSPLSNYYYGSRKVIGTACVEDDAGSVYNPSSLKPSNKVSIPMEGAPMDRKYRMKAVVDDQVYLSDWLEPLAPPEIEALSFLLSKDSITVQVAATLNGGKQGTGYIGLTYDETWEFHADFRGEYYLDTLSWEVVPDAYPNYWCWKSASSSGMILVNYTEMTGDRVVSYPFQAFSVYNNRNQKLYSINVKAITLSDKAFKYLSNLSSISNMNGSLFSPNPGEMPSNIRCDSDPGRHVEGYVFASQIISCRGFLDSRYYKPSGASTSVLFLPEPGESYRELYENGAYPVAFMRLSIPTDEGYQDVEDVFWGPIRCIDCVVAGGTKQKPDFWP